METQLPTPLIAVLGCMDERVLEATIELLQKEGHPLGTFILKTQAGAAHNLTLAKAEIKIAVTSKHAQELWIIDHEDCFSHKQSYGKSEKAHHVRWLQQAARWVAKEYQGLKIRLFFLNRIDDQHWVPEEIQAES